MKNMNVIGKKELVKIVAEKTGATEKISTVAKVIDAVFDAIQETVSKDNKVQIVDFGTFRVGKAAERKGRNPQTGEEITIPAHNRAVFIPSKKFKARVN